MLTIINLVTLVLMIAHILKSYIQIVRGQQQLETQLYRKVHVRDVLGVLVLLLVI